MRPAGRCPRSRAASLAATSSSKAGFARERNRSPASAKPTLRVVRMKSAAPTRAPNVPYSLAERRWRHREFRRHFTEIAVLGDAKERLYAVECALPDCEVLLHSPLILSRIVVRGKQP